MKLDDFLKVKRVRCVDECVTLTVGKLYEVVGVNHLGRLKVIDDIGLATWYDFEYFEHIPPQPKFEVGQKAYCPYLNGGNLVVLESNCDYLFAETANGKQYFNLDGTSVEVKSPAQPDLFHATQGNYELLSQLMYWLEFEKPC